MSEHVPMVTSNWMPGSGHAVHTAVCPCGWVSARPFNDIVKAARAARDHARMAAPKETT